MLSDAAVGCGTGFRLREGSPLHAAGVPIARRLTPFAFGLD